MGHLMFAGLFVFFIILLVAKIYFSYIYASKKKIFEDDNAKMPEESEKQEKYFYVHKGITLLGGFLVFLTPFLLVYFFNLLEKEPQDSDFWWAMIDSLIFGFFIFAILLITGLRSYVHINKEGFEYQGTFRTKSYSKEDIEHVCRTTEFIFIKLKNCRIPVTIEAIYNNNDCLYSMLYNLNSK